MPSRRSLGAGLQSQASTDPTARLFIADSHPMILDSLTRLFLDLAPSIDVVCFATVSALEAALDQEGAPDLVLASFAIPGLTTVGAVCDFLGRYSDYRIAVISGHVNSELTRELFRLGCAGFISKTLPTRAIFHAVRLMMAGERLLPNDQAERPPVPASLPVPAPTAWPSEQREFNLSRREVEVLRALMGGRTNKQIGRELDIEEATVKLHLRRGYEKLGVRNRVGAVGAVLAGALD